MAPVFTLKSSYHFSCLYPSFPWRPSTSPGCCHKKRPLATVKLFTSRTTSMQPRPMAQRQTTFDLHQGHIGFVSDCQLCAMDLRPNVSDAFSVDGDYAQEVIQEQSESTKALGNMSSNDATGLYPTAIFFHRSQVFDHDSLEFEDTRQSMTPSQARMERVKAAQKKLLNIMVDLSFFWKQPRFLGTRF